MRQSESPVKCWEREKAMRHRLELVVRYNRADKISHDRQRIINAASLFRKNPITGLRLVRGLSITLGSHNGIN